MLYHGALIEASCFQQAVRGDQVSCQLSSRALCRRLHQNEGHCDRISILIWFVLHLPRVHTRAVRLKLITVLDHVHDRAI